MPPRKRGGQPGPQRRPRERHGRAGTPLYVVWREMVARCTNHDHPNFHHYGGRGIEVCPRWRDSFSAFLADMGERPDGMTIDRVDRDGPYSPENCRWTTQAEQNRNTRRNRLTWEVVRKIRADPRPPAVAAPDYGLSRQYISDIRRGVRWREESPNAPR